MVAMTRTMLTGLKPTDLSPQLYPFLHLHKSRGKSRQQSISVIARDENVGEKSEPTEQSKIFRVVSISQLLQQTPAANPALPQTTGALEVT